MPGGCMYQIYRAGKIQKQHRHQEKMKRRDIFAVIGKILLFAHRISSWKE